MDFRRRALRFLTLGMQHVTFEECGLLCLVDAWSKLLIWSQCTFDLVQRDSCMILENQYLPEGEKCVTITVKLPSRFLHLFVLLQMLSATSFDRVRVGFVMTVIQSYIY